MIYGFTGTHLGMTPWQREGVRHLFKELGLTELHHGDCVGADAEAHVIALQSGAAVVVHPPADSKLRAFCAGRTVHPPRAYLRRNRDIVREGTAGLIAAPRQMEEPTSKRGEGTWTTVGYAEQAGRKVWLVLPDGTITVRLPPVERLF